MLHNCKMIDLTHGLHESVPTWNGESGFRKKTIVDYAEGGIRVLNYECLAGVGTHMDAPSHFIPNGKDISSLNLEDLIVPACVIDISSNQNPDYFISVRDIETFEKLHGPIPEKSLVIGYTGWSRFWKTPEKYRNADRQGNLHVPGLSADAARVLLARNVVGIGIDTLSPDGSNVHEFPVHHLLLGNGKYIIENLTNLQLVPPKGSFLFALPLKIEGGSESPIRAVALIPEGKNGSKTS